MASSCSDTQERRRLIGPSLEADDVCPVGGIGPALPLDVFKTKIMERSDTSDDPGRLYTDDLTTIGPLIPGRELQEEFRHLKSKSIDQDDSRGTTQFALKRDAWMTELMPVSREIVALKPRKFEQRISSTSGNCDSSWFKVPGSDAPDQSSLESTENVVTSWKRLADREYDKRMDDILSKCNANKDSTSLLDLHTEKLGKRSKKRDKNERTKKHKSKHKKHKSERARSRSPEKPIRRPFDRDKDLKCSVMRPAARQALIQHSKQLSGRFGYGSRQFL